METDTLFIEFVEQVGSWAPGHIEPLKRSVAEGFIEAKQAKPSDALHHMRASLQADNDRRMATLEERLLGALKPAAPANPSPPNGGGAVDFGRISEPSRTAADDARNLCLADAMRCMFLVQATGVDPALAEFGRQRLRHYVGEVRKYQADVNTGEIRMVIERSIGADGRGLEVITRDGTDSLSGGASYGYTLKPTYIDDLFRIARGQEVFAPATRKVPMSQGNEAKWPALGQFTAPRVVNGIPMPASIAGVTLYYKGETAQRTASDASTRMIDFKAEDLTGLTKFSRDYIVDNYINMNAVVTEIFGIAIGLIEDWVTMFGSGIAMPEGFANSKAFVQRTRDTTSHLKYEDVMWMMSRMAAGCLTRSRWLTNQTTMPELAAVQNHAGNTVFLPNSMVVQSMMPSLVDKTTADANVSRMMGTLMGLPVYFAEYIPSLGQANDLMLVCPDQYGLAERAGLEVMVSDQVYFETDEIGYKFKRRHDGKSLWPAPYIQADNLASIASGTQVSPFIGIAA